MTTAASEDTGAEKFELELYKILKSESSTYLDKLQALWLQKFILVGAVIAFLVTNREMLSGEGYGIMVAAAIFTIPVLAALLDAKILEFSLYARSISRFIDSHFVTLPTVTQWERVLWGLEGAPEDLKIARVRHLMTVLVAIVPTIAIWLLASIALGQLTGQGSMWRSLGMVGGVPYALVTWLSWRIMWAGTR
jgi:hypothetical protein